ncbi:hypothetical protein C8F01DRAFT_1374910, partial [Mycena amicta]
MLYSYTQQHTLRRSSNLLLPMTSVLAKELSVLCQTTPGLSTFQPAAASILELASASINYPRKNTEALAASVLKRFSSIVQLEQEGKLSVDGIERQTHLERIETNIDLIRKLVETRSSTWNFMWQTHGLKAEFKRNCKALIQSRSSRTETSRSEVLLETVSIGVQIATAVCDAPVVNVFKPVAGLVGVINNTAMTVKSNQEAAVALTKHAQDVTNTVLKQGSSGTVPEDSDALKLLHGALQESQSFLCALSHRSRRVSWLLASSDKKRFNEINARLDKALAVFVASGTVDAKLHLHHTTAELSRLVTAVGRLRRPNRANAAAPIEAVSLRLQKHNRLFLHSVVVSDLVFFFL